MLRILAAILLISTAASADATVQRSDSGIGGALVLPYWTVAQGNDTLIALRNEFPEPTSARVRLLDDAGVPAFAFNVYLDAHDVWVAALTWDDAAVIVTPDASCMYPDAPGGLPPLPPGSIPAAWGSIEIIEMGRPDPAGELSDFGRWIPCEDLVARFADGPWSEDPDAGLLAPAGGLSASATLVDVLDGGMATYAATALIGFSDAPLHSAPADPQPDLASATDSDAPGGGTRSRLCTVTAGCVVHEWALPEQAVAAALMTFELIGDFSVGAGANGQTEMVLHRPMKRYTEDGAFDILTPMRVELRDRDGARVPRVRPIVCDPPPPGGDPCLNIIDQYGADPITTVIPFAIAEDQLDQATVTSILGHPVTPRFALFDIDGVATREAGTARFTLPLMQPLVQLQHPDGTFYAGEPLIGVVFQQFANGTLDFGEGPVLSNYRSADPMRPVARLGADE